MDSYPVPAGVLTVAAGQAACTGLDIPANVAVAAELVRRAADQGADLVVLPDPAWPSRAWTGGRWPWPGPRTWY
ncbi:MAG TPA: hypothetical protein VK453_21570 [Micromonosporaceae bacterium]|nr:hypothetical protein [Micromonosporaceae bacterium]